jgi:hypothetical protein
MTTIIPNSVKWLEVCLIIFFFDLEKQTQLLVTALLIKKRLHMNLLKASKKYTYYLVFK